MRSLFAAAFALVAFVCAPAAAEQQIDPPFYVVRDVDSTMYLYGTVHIRPRGAEWGTQRVRDAIA